MLVVVIYVFFFFQAEDGIRDYKVTGVQTCALPIFRRVAAEMHGDVVLPFDLVPEMVLVPRRQGIVDIELLVRISKWNRSYLAVQRRAAWIAAVVVAEGATCDRIDRRMPRGIELVIGSDDRVGIVLRLGAVVVRTRRPESEGRGVAGGRSIVGGGRHIVTRCRHHRASGEKMQQG